MTALHHAARLGLAEIAIQLLEANADPNCNDFQQQTPLHQACISNHPALINILTSFGALWEQTDIAGYKPKHYLDKAQGVHFEPAIDNVQDNIANNNESAESSSRLGNKLSSLFVK